MTLAMTFWLLFQSMLVGVGVHTIIWAFTKDRPELRPISFIGGWCWMCAAIAINFRVFS